jgi:hypothetical protein
MSDLPREDEDRALDLEVRIEGDELWIDRATWTSRAPRAILRPPLLGPETWRRYTPPAGEIAIATLTLEGRPLETFGWPAAPMAFFDRHANGDYGEIEGRPQPSGIPMRLLRIPAPADTAFLYLYRSDLDGSAVAPVGQRALYYIPAPGRRPPRIPDLPGPPLSRPVRLRPLDIRFPRRRRRLLAPLRPRRPPRRPRNRLDGVVSLVTTGPPADRFDIVILGDGFAEHELGIFDHRAVTIAAALLQMPPFAALRHLINIHTVRAISAESGITDCPAASATRRTYFGARGNFNGSFPGFIGVANPQRVYAAAELIAPRSELDLFLIIANCAIEGGSAFPDLRLAFVTMYTDLVKFANIAAHEMAHVMARNAEEYIGCAPADPMNRYPNQATEADRVAGTVPWTSLALPAELDASGGFRAVHVQGDPFDASNEPVLPPSLTGMLGLYWGCQDIDVPPGGGTVASCDPYQDPRGARFFRPMARCKMRKSFFDFCRVCSDRIAQVIQAAAP